MCRTFQAQLVILGIGWSFAFPAVRPVAAAEPAERPVIGQGEVTGNNVHVRSGNSLNHYPVCKLNAGDRVEIVGEKGGWYEILPPEGTFSLVSGDYVDTADDKTGVINGNNVRIRAGSLLNSSKYTVQMLLSKGAQVAILGRNPDGFLRIVPPDGATVWISRDFVARSPEERGQREQTARPPDEPEIGATEAGMASPGAPDDEAVPSRPVEAASLVTALPPTPQRRELARIDAEVEADLAKPLLERKFEPLIERYRATADQEEDEFARRYARARIEQLANMAEVAETVRKVRRLSEQTEAQRREFMAARAQMHEAPLPEPSALDAQGELRVSALYPPGSLPRRYRLVDPSSPPGRTIAYVDIPPESTLDAKEFLGRYVGLRASRKRLQVGGVNPVPIYTVRELVLLEPAEPDTPPHEQP